MTGYDRMLALDLEDLAVDAPITKSCGGGRSRCRSPVDRGKQGIKGSIVVDVFAIPLFVVAAGADAHDFPMLDPTWPGFRTWSGLPQAAAVPWTPDTTRARPVT